MVEWSVNKLKHKIQHIQLCCIFTAKLDVLYFMFWPFFNVCQKTDARYSIASVRLSACLSVTRWYCVETAQPIIKLSSLPGSPMTLVF